jgi:hypothetical protein
MTRRTVILLALVATMGGANITSAQTDVLLVQTSAPWTTQSNEQCLGLLGLTYDFVTDWNQVDWANLANYRVMLIVNDQAQGFYDGHASHVPQLEQFVQDGGDLLFFAAGAGWAGGQLTAPLPGGLPWHFDGAAGDYANYNIIDDYTHAIVTSQLSDNIPLDDTVMNGNYCSHGYFRDDELLAETRVLFRQSPGEGGNPTCIDYRVGMGHVVASTNTWEYHYAGMGVAGLDGFFAQRNLDDVFLYMLAVGGVTAPDAVIYQHYITTSPSCLDGDVPVGTVITVSSRVSNFAAVAITSMDVYFSYEDEWGTEVPIGMVTGATVPADGEVEVGVQWDTAGLDPGVYTIKAEAVVIAPEELVENQDNNWSARDCTLIEGNGDDDDDDDDTGGQPDDDTGMPTDDDDDDSDRPQFGCECNAAASSGPTGLGLLAALFALATFRRRSA